MTTNIQELIEQAFDNREMLKNDEVRDAIRQTIELLDKGELRVAERRRTTALQCPTAGRSTSG